MNNLKLSKIVVNVSRINNFLIVLLPVLAMLSILTWEYNLLLNVSLVLTLFILLFIVFINIKQLRRIDILFLLLNFLSVLITYISHSGLGVSLIFLNLFLCCMLFNTLSFSKKTIRRVHILVVFLLFLYAFTSSASVRYNWVTFIDKNGTIINNNTVALLLVALFSHLSLFILEQSQSTFRRFFCLILWGVCMYGTYILGCRSALMFFFIYIFLFLFKKTKFSSIKFKKYITVFLLLSLLFPIIYLLIYYSVENFTLLGKSLFSGRQDVWKNAFEQIISYPIFGSGTDYSLNMVNGLTTESVHNMLLGTWKNLGIIPLITLITYFVRKKRENWNMYSQILILSCIIIAFFESFMMEARLYLFFALLLLGTKETDTPDFLKKEKKT